jgi:hypothetical protein
LVLGKGTPPLLDPQLNQSSGGLEVNPAIYLHLVSELEICGAKRALPTYIFMKMYYWNARTNLQYVEMYGNSAHL